MTIVSEHTPGTRRNTELFLLVLAVCVAMACYAMVGIGNSEERALPTGILWYGGGLLLLTGAVHLILRRYAPYADPVILPIATLLNGMGLALIHRIDLAKVGTLPYYQSALAPKQLMWSTVGVVLCAATLVVVRRHQKLRNYTYISMLASIILLILPIIPGLGRPVNGAQIWVFIGPFSFQPGELTKIALTIFFAGYLVSNRDQLALAGAKILGMRLPRARDLGPLLIVWMISIGVLVVQRDLGTSLLFFGVFVAMIYIATERASWVVVALVMFGSGAFFAWTRFTHVQQRVDVWLDPFNNELFEAVGGSRQLVEGLFGMAKGGLLGTGLGQGRPYLVPFVESDFIIAEIGEELGLVGLFAVLMLYMILVERAFRTAIGVRDGFGKLLAAGLGFVICLQVFVVVGGVTRTIPLTGLTTPFLAYGGSSLVANWIIVGILLRVSDSARQPTVPTSTRVTPDDDATTALSVSDPDQQATGVVPVITDAKKETS